MIDALNALDPANQHPSADLLARNLAIKARVVEEDERETAGTRALLNFGHTVGHGIEASLPYGEMLHGEAISLGIRSALYLSERINDFPAADSQRILQFLSTFQLPLTLPDSIDTETILAKLQRDKKFSGGISGHCSCNPGACSSTVTIRILSGGNMACNRSTATWNNDLS